MIVVGMRCDDAVYDATRRHAVGLCLEILDQPVAVSAVGTAVDDDVAPRRASASGRAINPDGIALADVDETDAEERII